MTKSKSPAVVKTQRMEQMRRRKSQNRNKERARRKKSSSKDKHGVTTAADMERCLEGRYERNYKLLSEILNQLSMAGGREWHRRYATEGGPDKVFFFFVKFRSIQSIRTIAITGGVIGPLPRPK